MKKIALISLALIVALGGLGIGYAAWTDTVTVSGDIATGNLCLSIDEGRVSEVGGCPDKNWVDWVYDGASTSCPPGYHFEGIHNDEEGKCVGEVSFAYHDYDGDGYTDTIDVIITDAYPYYATDISFWVCNCGTIPLKIKAPVIVQDPYLLIEYGDNIGKQLHPGQCAEISFFVGVTQHEGYFDANGMWIVDDTNQPLTGMNTTYTFTINIEGIQWNEY
jgi:predicted ribosomally synthesized peptide with SipW-like signal peptide